MGSRCAGCRPPTADSEPADATTRPGRGGIIRLRSAACQQLQVYFGENAVDQMTASETAQPGAATGTGEQRDYRSIRSPVAGGGSAGVDASRQNIE